MSCRGLVVGALMCLVPALAAAQDAPPTPVEPPKPAPVAPATPSTTLDSKAVRKLASQVTALAVSPDGKWIAAGGHDGSVALFATGSAERHDVGTVDNYVISLVFSADSAWVVAAPRDKDGTQVLLAADVATGKVLRKMDVSAPVPPGGSRIDLNGLSQACSVPGTARVELLRKDTIDVWDLATGEAVERRANKDPWVQFKVRSADGSLAAIDGTGPIRIVDGSTGDRRIEIQPEEGGMKGNVLISSHNVRVAGFATAAGVVLLRDTWDEVKDPKTLTGDNLDKRTKDFRKLVGVSLRDGKPIWKRDLPQYVYVHDIIVGAEVAAVADDGKLTFINCATGQLREKAPTSKTWSSAAVSPDGLTFWGGADDGSVVVLKTFPAPKTK